MNIQTGYFARASEKKHTAKWTKVHLVKPGKRGLIGVCGYVPHKTMQFQFNVKGIQLDYVECNKCKEGLSFYFEVDSYIQLNKDRCYAKFYENWTRFGLKDVVKGYNRSFDTEEKAREHGRKCVKTYRKFLKQVK